MLGPDSWTETLWVSEVVPHHTVLSHTRIYKTRTAFRARTQYLFSPCSGIYEHTPLFRTDPSFIIFFLIGFGPSRCCGLYDK